VTSTNAPTTGDQQAVPRVVAIVGPTASGKTALAIALAERFGGEIVNADSRQVYRFMDIGTAKPTPEEQARIPHHLIDIRYPDEPFGLAEFLDEASRAIIDITRRMRLPIVAGGTGQYVRALLHGWRAPAVPPDPTYRAHLAARAATAGPDALHTELAAADPQAAAAIDPRNVRRVIRALEVIHHTGRPFSAQQGRGVPPFSSLVIGLALRRETLYARIDARVEAMFAAGLVEEVRGLLARGYSCAQPALNAIGYVEVCGYLRGNLTLAAAMERTKTGTHRLARTQANWFRRSDPAIHWLDAEHGLPARAAAALVQSWLASPNPLTPPPALLPAGTQAEEAREASRE
jgi:tRNA dimethylallyltransferase